MARGFIVTLIFVLSFTFGCALFQDDDATLIQIGTLTGTLYEDYKELEVEMGKIIASEITPEESKETLKDILKKARVLAEEFEAIRNGKKMSDVDLYALYKQGRTLYIEGKPILIIYYESKGKDPSEFLKEFDAQATRLDKLVQQAEQSYNVNATALSNLYSFVASIIKILIATMAL